MMQYFEMERQRTMVLCSKCRKELEKDEPRYLMSIQEWKKTGPDRLHNTYIIRSHTFCEKCYSSFESNLIEWASKED